MSPRIVQPPVPRLPARPRTPLALSVVVPVLNEAPNVPILHAELSTVLDELGVSAEIIFVDDGSTDTSADIVRALVARDPRVRLLRLRARAGITAAFDAGFRAARGDVVVTLDADLQNDPRDIPRLLAALAQADMATGWRRVRRDPWLKRVSSRVGNGVRRRVLPDSVHDSGCSLRAIRRHCLDDLWLLDGLHRLLPTLLARRGHRVVEVEVTHRPRLFGTSKFGVRNRAWRALVDLLAVRWLVAGAPRLGHAAALALLWLCVAGLLAGWAAASDPRRATLWPGADGAIPLAGTAPEAPLLSVWVWWDAPATHDGWLVLEAGTPWPSAAEAFWRRRVHPGWNLLVWSQASTLPSGAPVTLRLARGSPAAWGAAEPEVAARYGVRHLVELRGLLLAFAVTTLAGAGALFRRRRSFPRPGGFELALGAAMALALGLRLRTLTTQSLWFDEVLTAIGVQSFDWVLYTPQVFGHPPLHYLTGWLLGAAGTDEGWLRAPFVIAGVTTVGALGWLGRLLFGPATGVAAAVALAVSPFHIELSQTARPYALFVLLSVLSMLALVTALERRRAVAWLLFTGTTALTIYTHYLGATLLVLQALFVLAVLAARRAQGGGAALVSFAAVGVLLAPWAPVLGRLAGAQLGHGDLPASTLHRLVVDVFVPQFLGPGAAAVLGLALVARGGLALRREARTATLMALWLVVPVALVWVAQPGHFVAGRHLALVIPPLLLALARGITATATDLSALATLLPTASRRPVRVTGAAAAVGLLVAWTLPVGAALRGYYESRLGSDWRTVAGVLDGIVSVDDRVVATAGAAYPLRRYWRHDIEALEPTTMASALALEPGERLWIVRHRGWDRPPELDEWLARDATLVAEVAPSWSLPGVDVFRAARK